MISKSLNFTFSVTVLPRLPVPSQCRQTLSIRGCTSVAGPNFVRSAANVFSALETRDRVRSIGEQICDYADVEGDGYNPFRNLNGQMIANISTPRPGVTEPRDVTRVFKLTVAGSAALRVTLQAPAGVWMQYRVPHRSGA
jgi:hypothetical protein